MYEFSLAFIAEQKFLIDSLWNDDSMRIFFWFILRFFVNNLLEWLLAAVAMLVREGVSHLWDVVPARIALFWAFKQLLFTKRYYQHFSFIVAESFEQNCLIMLIKYLTRRTFLSWSHLIFCKQFRFYLFQREILLKIFFNPFMLMASSFFRLFYLLNYIILSI